MNHILISAKEYRQRGFSLIPMHNKTKRPSLLSWKEFQSAIPTEQELETWFEHGGNIAIVTGKLSGITVIDFDSEEAYAQLKGKLPAHPLVKTAKGYHAYFKYTAGLPTNAGAKLCGVVVDIRNDGGLIVAPPSIHETGVQYRWIKTLDDVSLSHIPESVVATYQAPGKIAPDTQLPKKQLPVSPPPTDMGLKYSVKDFMDMVLSGQGIIDFQPPQVFKLFEWLEAGDITMVAANRGVGKTMFALYVSLRLAMGQKCWNWITSKVDVLYVDGEMKCADMQARIKLFTGGTVPEGFHLLNGQTYHSKKGLHLPPLDMSNPDFQSKVLEAVDAKPAIKLVVFDNLSCLAKIHEDSSDDWRQLIAPFLLQLQGKGIAVMMVHHNNKKGLQRGTNAREDALSTSITLDPVDSGGMEGTSFKVRFTKTRGLYGAAVTPFTAKLHSDGTWDTSFDASTKDAVLDLIKKAGANGIRNKDLASRLDLLKSSVSMIKSDLLAEGKIRIKGKNLVAVDDAVENPDNVFQEQDRFENHDGEIADHDISENDFSVDEFDKAVDPEDFSENNRETVNSGSMPMEEHIDFSW